MADLITLADIQAAQQRIAGTAVRTPLIRIETAAGSPAIYLKDESAQPIGSFKIRGAYNMIAQLTPEQLQRGVITYSSGNHAQGVAYAARALGSRAVIVMPSNAPQIKRDATAALGAEIVTVGPASSERKQRAESLAAEFGYTIIPPYDDPAIIAGQATCGLEILEQLPDVDIVLSPVSGGGLLSGVATAIKLSSSTASVKPTIGYPEASASGLISAPNDRGFSPGGKAPAVYGCEPALAADAAESFRTKTLVEWPASDTSRTLCDGLRTQSLGQLNFAHVLRFVDGIVTVTEAEIREATRIILQTTSIVAEPSGAITLAAALFHAAELPTAQKIVVIVSGGNIDPTLRAELVNANAAATV